MRLRFRSVLLASVAGLLLLLSACGHAFESAAAIVNGNRITQEALEVQLESFLSNPQIAPQVRGPEGAAQRKIYTREILAFMIRKRLVQAYAARQGIAVAPTEIDSALKQVVQQTGGPAGFNQQLKRRHLTVQDVRANIEESLLEGKIAQTVGLKQFGPNATDQQRSAAFNQWLSLQFRSGDIEVNPRIGRLDPSTGTICAVDSTADTTTCPAA